ncbi:MAG TPA: sugar phosphate nucleotidyltransferase [Candidatus Nanoarchaeia archaeon]|nr:mannose-1-phosphate guanylyltransferase RfbM [uncultured archaeon]
MKIVVFSGGAGTRMWPMSRAAMPKQFQPLVGKTSMFQQMLERLARGFDTEDIYVVTGADYVGLVKKQAPSLPTENIIGEPQMRDTLAAVSFACAYLSAKFPNETMAAIWGADHLVKEEKTFIKALKAAEKLAKKEGVIAKVDVHPVFPSVHLGYIEIGERRAKIDSFEVFEFIRHVEKPNLSTAEKFLESGKYLWNTGYFVWELSKIMALFKKHLPEIYKSLKKIQLSLGTPKEKEVVAEEYQKIPRNSFDYAFLEKLGPGDQLEIPAVLGWTDIGAWNTLKDELAESEVHNVVRGEHIGINSEDLLVFGPEKGKLIATVGLKGMIIVDTPDALLICPKERSQDVKKIVQELRERRKHKYL